jgi:hypothetical protein
MSGYTGDTNPSVLGGGIPGGAPKLLGGGANAFSGSGMIGGGMRATDRLVLRTVFGNNNFPGSSLMRITPFRRYMNAGDTAGTVNSTTTSSLGRPPNQVKGRSTVSIAKARYDGVRYDGGAYYTGNVKYVYDGSDYVKFKRLSAENKTYNDLTFGGDNASTAQSALRRVRRGF